MQKWFFTLQSLLPLRIIDTSNGSYAETPPPAGLNASTGQSNQNQEITYIKASSDANVFTLSGVLGGPYTLTAQYQSLKIKSDGTNWWLDSAGSGGGGGGSTNFADGEVPVGAIDGFNSVFTLVNAPGPVASLQLFCGIPPLTYIMKNGVDYTVLGNQITFTSPPLIGSEIVAWYRY